MNSLNMKDHIDGRCGQSILSVYFEYQWSIVNSNLAKCTINGILSILPWGNDVP